MRPATVKRSIAVVAVLACLMLLAYWLLPGLGKIPLDSEVESWDEARLLRDRIAREHPPGGPDWVRLREITLDGAHVITPLVEATFFVTARRAGDGKGVVFTYQSGEIKTSWDRLIFFIAFLAGAALFIWNAREGLPQKDSADETKIGDTLEEVLKSEVAHCTRLCERIYRRSTLLLQAALLAIIGGMGALFRLPDPTLEPSDPWLLLTRPYGIVLLVNAITLLLLRQYHSLTRDYKYMVSLRWRRVNFLAAFLGSGPGASPQVVQELLEEAYPEERLRDSSGAPASTADTEMIQGAIATLKSVGKPEGK